MAKYDNFILQTVNKDNKIVYVRKVSSDVYNKVLNGVKSEPSLYKYEIIPTTTAIGEKETSNDLILRIKPVEYEFKIIHIDPKIYRMMRELRNKQKDLNIKVK